MSDEIKRIRARVLGVPIDVIDWNVMHDLIMRWALVRESHYVAICNVHVTVTAGRNPEFLRAIEESDIATPDGAPVAWLMRKLGHCSQRRIPGPDVMWELLKRCESASLPVYIYGSTDVTLDKLKERCSVVFPKLKLFVESPPFRPLNQEEDEAAVQRIVASGAGVLFVGLGCPKQELWMHSHSGRIPAVMLGVGAALDFHAGTVTRAPLWMQNHGLEWLHRLLSEPRRLWRRYLVTNTLFVIGAVRQLLKVNA